MCFQGSEERALHWMEQVDTPAYLLYTLKAGSMEVYQALSVVCRAYTDSSS